MPQHPCRPETPTVRNRGLGRYAVKDDSDHSKLHLDKVVKGV